MGSANASPFVQPGFLCRGEGVGYVVLCATREVHEVRVTASLKDGTPIPCSRFCITAHDERALLAPGAANAWVAMVPLLAADSVIEVVAAGEESCSVGFPALWSKVASRLLSVSKPHVADALRGIERREGYGAPMVRIHEVWPGTDGRVVWRVRASLPCEATEDCGETASLNVFDPMAMPVHTHPVVLEDQVVPDKRDSSAYIRLVTFACDLPERLHSFFVVVSSGARAGFDAMNAPRAEAMLAHTTSLATGGATEDAYARWFAAHRVTTAELERQRAAYARMRDLGPLFGLVTCVRDSNEDVEAVARTIGSLRAQSYENWELVVVFDQSARNALQSLLDSLGDVRVRLEQRVTSDAADDDALAYGAATCAEDQGVASVHGDYVGLMDCGSVLEHDALWCFARQAASNPRADLMYCDEDRLCSDIPCFPSFKTFANYGKLYIYNYIGHLALVSRWALEHMATACEQAAAAYDYELLLRAMEVARDICQVPRVLYHNVTDAKSAEDSVACLDVPSLGSFAIEAGRCALEAHLARRNIAAVVVDGPLPGSYDVRYELPNPLPRASIVIPTRDHADLLGTCVRSILQQTTYGNIEIVLVENGSVDPQTFELYEELQATSACVRVVVWEPPEQGGFNYSALVNFGVAHSSGELIVLLNNDTEVLESAWLERMAGCLMRPEVGIVGAKLLFVDGLIQHVGMVANPEGGFCHVCQHLTSEAAGPANAVLAPGDYSMVTGACQMIRRSLYEELGGYDEELAVGFNDGDFCLRARAAGYAVTVCEGAVLRHCEFASRGRESTDIRLRERYMAEHARVVCKHPAFFAQGDPAINPNLDPWSAYFTL